MTLIEWRKDPERVKSLRQVLENPTLKEAISVLRNKVAISATSISEQYALIRLGRLEERQLVFQELEFMATHPSSAVDLKPSYSEE